ncbi:MULTISPECIES: winged helix-turn-helix transcriptional regulator [Alphaproteobacteria]|uniref:Transcriptional regulator n=2 Tax=Alphaproteobacteria TaxID=28211 RepID=A0A512HG53_9HYPH|nr:MULTISPECIES: helix-turn-helix domain-containing protein [Alphaproteobacteria]GEO84434.1 transcriptional regulator [Ciceribacter naphthalenivorans]GLR22397.1 transcriptional regulator [Ciceribacter naphthalenivorans]GLT05253.1 transcriptional regulator [Sphingomonas psychrolutea]
MSRPRAKMTNNFPGCPVESTLSLLDGKWKGVILYHLITSGTLRFSELQRKLKSVTQRMLTKQLRELEESGIVSRTVFAVVPPRVDYSLTPLGRTLEPVIMALGQWGETHVVCQDGKKYVVMPEEASDLANEEALSAA